MTKRQLFISHKHSPPDKEIAALLAKFIRNRSNNEVNVHLSSDPRFGGPEVGGGLTEQLRGALGESGVVLLVYTRADQDWSYCMWECGVATDPDTSRTHVKVIQCGTDVPRPFAMDLRVNARDSESVEGFVRSFMTSPDFFPEGGAVTSFEKLDSEVEIAARDLFDDLQDVIPVAGDHQPIARTPWPFIAIELDGHQVEELRSATPDESEEVGRKVLCDAFVVESDQAEGLFGIDFEARQRVGELLRVWRDKHPDEDDGWFDALAMQVVDGANRRREPVIRWRPLLGVNNAKKFLLVLGRTLSYPGAEAMRFEVFFFVAEPEEFARYRMIPRGQIWSLKADSAKCAERSLLELIEELDTAARTRMPFLGESGEPVMIVHRSMVDRFALQAMFEGKDLRTLTVQDLVDQPEMRAMFESTFGVVHESASLDEVRRVMASIPNCQDVFVTQDGKPESAVVGWITNTMISNRS